MAHADLPLMPWPSRVERRPGVLSLPSRPDISISEASLASVARRFGERLNKKTGLETSFAPAKGTIRFELVSGAASDPEGYELMVDERAAVVRAEAPTGLMRGAETLLQLVSREHEHYRIPAVEIRDQPRFRWRGVLIDPARHFLPVALVKRFLDCMAAVKLNVLHWHLADDQGFRMESRKYPRLHQLGSDGEFYRQDQVAEIVAYAADHGIRIVPEFDVPGHTTSWLVGYPHLGSAPGDEMAGQSGGYELKRSWGPSQAALDPTRDAIYEFLDGLFGEMAALFPDRYVHIGGDEVLAVAWSSNPRIVRFMREHGMIHPRDLQAYFNQKVCAILQKYDKRMVGWDEILHRNLPDTVVVQSWRGHGFFAEALQRHEALLSSGYYLDQLLPASYHYLVDPRESTLTDAEAMRIAGGEACLWGEYIGVDNFDSRAWPRLCAVAERLWSPAEGRDLDSMYARLEQVSRHLEELGALHQSNYRRMLERLTEGTAEEVEALGVLAEVVEPVKFYDRAIARLDSSFTPLTRLVDVVHPESDTARRFNKLVGGYLENGEGRAQIVEHLTRWREHRRVLLPAIQRSLLINEIDEISRHLERAAQAGLEALGQEVTDGGERWWLRQVARLERAKAPRAELVLVVLPAIRQLVDHAPARRYLRA
jgi:hexosaminidase